ncbi:ABC transporter ATP-binding protein [Maritalea sp.]|uniref:ABC transporter ATP-binding protein n=1 Tax=Maritalea sp. TaxID=2003361 RepID=UPI003EFAD375
MFRFVAGLVDPFQRYAAVTPASGALSFILQNLRPMRRIVLICFITTIFAALIEVWLVYYAGHLIDQLVSIERTNIWQDMGGEMLLAVLVLLVLRPGVALLNEALDDIAFRPATVSLIRWRAHQHIMKQSVGWFKNQQSGQLATRVRELGVSATNVVYAVLHTLIYVVTYFICSVWLLAAIDIRLAIPLLIWAGLYGAHMVYAVPRFRDNYEKFENSKTELTSQLVDAYSNIETVKLFTDQSHEDPNTFLKFQNALTSFIGVQRFEVLINVGMVFLSNLLLVGLVGYSILLWQSGDAMLGMVAASLALATRISSMAEWMLDSVASIYGNIGATREALSSIAQPINIKDAPNAPAFIFKGGAIKFDNVTHRYGQSTGGLSELSLDIGAGEKVALVGPSGAGKSTIVNLLMRHYQPEGGHIFVDQQDISLIKQDSLCQNIASVAQDASLLNRSIRENISLGQSDASISELIAAARKAKADDFIRSIKDYHGNAGYDAIVGERGVRLSGGQKQRVSLARALLRNAPILILDEATSALDSQVEAEILETLYDFMSDKTVIAIAHRLSTIAHMDKIAVIDNGAVVEFGTHKDLLAKHGLYAKLWNMQVDGLLGTL